MIEVTRETVIDAAPDRLWPLVSEVARLPEWLTFAQEAETLAGEGVGRRQRVHGRWGEKRSEVDQVVTHFEAPHRIEWRHEAERLDGKPAPVFARETRFSITLEPDGPDRTRVALNMQQEPASRLRGFAMKRFGTRQAAQGMERSLERLSAAAAAPPA